LLSDWISCADLHREKRRSYLRQNSFHVEVHEVQVNPFTWLPLEKVVALGVPRVVARVVGRGEASVGAVRTVERESARVLHQLPTPCHSEIWQQHATKMQSVDLSKKFSRFLCHDELFSNLNETF